MFKHKKARCEIEGFVFKGEGSFQITDDFFHLSGIIGMSAQKLFGDITGDISLRFQGRKIFEHSAVTSPQVYEWNSFISWKIFYKNTFVKTIKVFVVLPVLIGYRIVASFGIVDENVFLIVGQTKSLND